MTLPDLLHRSSSVGGPTIAERKGITDKTTGSTTTALKTVHEIQTDFTQSKTWAGTKEVDITDPYQFFINNLINKTNIKSSKKHIIRFKKHR